MKPGVAVALLSVTLLGACSIVRPPSSPRMSVHVLELPPLASPTAAATGTIVVASPTAAPGYGSSDMVYQRRENELEHFAFHRWAEPPAEMFAPLLVDALEATGAFSVVVRDPTRVPGDWRVDSQLTRFRQEFPGDGTSRVRVAARIQFSSTRPPGVLVSRSFERVEPAAEATPEGGVAAATVAVERLVNEIAAFCGSLASGPEER